MTDRIVHGLIDLLVETSSEAGELNQELSSAHARRVDPDEARRVRSSYYQACARRETARRALFIALGNGGDS